MMLTILAVCFVSHAFAAPVALDEEDAPKTPVENQPQERYIDLFEGSDFSDYDIDNLIGAMPRNNEVAKCLLKQHNFYRKAVGLHRLKWDYNLAKLAWNTSETFRDTECKDYHRYAFNQENWVGENLWSIKSMPYFFNEGRDLCKQAEQGVMEWYAEIQNYSFPLGDDVPFHKCGTLEDFKTYAHFIQMMWQKGRKIGCSYAYCMNYESLFAMPKIIINCYYDTPILMGSRVFSKRIAEKLNNWDFNEQFGGLRNCTPPEE